MCFSATASFTAAGGLATLGAIALARAARRDVRAMPLACMPLLFAAQQAVEGLVWLRVTAGRYVHLEGGLVLSYLFFALALWPVYVPLAAAAVERVTSRRSAQLAMALAGVALAAWLFVHARAGQPYACEVGGHLYYAVRLAPPLRAPVHAVYFAATVLPLLVSSRRGVRALGAALGAAFVLSAWAFTVFVVSVWCFLAAVLSAGLLALPGRDENATARDGARPRA